MQELFNKSDKEVEIILSNNKYIKNGAYVIRDNNIGIIKNKDKGQLVLDINDKLYLKYIEDIQLLTYEGYIKLKTSNRFNLINANLNVIANYLKANMPKTYGDNFEITFDNDDMEVIIHYPEIEIENSFGIKHKMTNVYNIFKFEYCGNLYLKNIQLFRSTYTQAEVNNDYMFSHTNQNVGRIASSFCYNNAPISTIINRFTKSISFNEIESLFMAFRKYLEWESLEGVPYRYIQKIKNYSVSSKSCDIDKDVFDNIYSHV